MKQRAGKEVIRLRNQLLAILLVVSGAALRLVTLSKASIWHDEGFSIMLSKQSLTQIWSLTARDVHPPGYYMLLHIWTRFWGESVFAIRSLSVVAGVGILIVAYLLVKRIAGSRAALLSLLFLALAPFLLRYSQEARMYGLLGLLMIGAVYALVRALEQPNRWLWFVVYGLCVLGGLYTHYFTILAVGAFWLYVLIENRGFLKSKKWWVANIVAVIGFLPWLPNMAAQLTRGQGLSWLPKASWQTFFDTMWQFMSFTDGRKLPVILYVALGLLFVAVGIFVWWRDHTKYQSWHLIVIFSFAPMLLAILVSFVKPVFHERYFMFASIGFYILLGIAIDQISLKATWLVYVLTLCVVLVEVAGVRNVISQSNHQMGQVMQTLNQSYQAGDRIISGELYTYFDGSYYNHTGAQMQLYAPAPPNGYGESSLLYKNADQIYLSSYDQMQPGRVWVVGKTGEHPYYDQIPVNWKLLQEREGGYSEVRLYQIQ